MCLKKLLQRRASLLHQSKKQMLGAQKFILHPLRFLPRRIQRALKMVAQKKIAGACAGHLHPAFQFAAQIIRELLQVYPKPLQQWRNEAFLLLKQCQEQMFPIDLLVRTFGGQALRALQGRLRSQVGPKCKPGVRP